MSPHYRRALGWARVVLQGLDRPVSGGQAPPVALDANDAFERFAEVVVRRAAALVTERRWVVRPQAGQSFLAGPQTQQRIPDVLLESPRGVAAVGDAKYKDVLERVPVEQLGDLEGAIVPRISPADWNQLYVYMRITAAPRGFFCVPFWHSEAAPLVVVPGFRFAVSPLDGRPPCVVVVGLNLLHPAEVVRPEALGVLARWLAGGE
jgi:hypothetical protein